MGFKEKVIKIITEAGMEEDIKHFSEKIQKDILNGVGRRMIEEQQAQNERFKDALANWEKLMADVIEKRIETAINKKL